MCLCRSRRTALSVSVVALQICVVLFLYCNSHFISTSTRTDEAVRSANVGLRHPLEVPRQTPNGRNGVQLPSGTLEENGRLVPPFRTANERARVGVHHANSSAEQASERLAAQQRSATPAAWSTDRPSSKSNKYGESMLAKALRVRSWKPVDTLDTARGSIRFKGEQVEKFIATIKKAIRGRRRGTFRSRHKSSQECLAKSSPTCHNVSTAELMKSTSIVGAKVEQRISSLVAQNSERIFVSVKTASVLYPKRLPPLLLTWLQTIDSQQVSHCVSHYMWAESAHRAQGYRHVV